MVLVREGVQEHLKLIAAMAITVVESVLLISIKYQLKQMIITMVSGLLSSNLVQMKFIMYNSTEYCCMVFA